MLFDVFLSFRRRRPSKRRRRLQNVVVVKKSKRRRRRQNVADTTTTTIFQQSQLQLLCPHTYPTPLYLSIRTKSMLCIICCLTILYNECEMYRSTSTT